MVPRVKPINRPTVTKLANFADAGIKALEPGAPNVIPMLVPELMVATITGHGELLHANPEWQSVFGTDGLWEQLEPDDRRFALEYVAEAAAGSLVSNQAFLVSPPGRERPIPVLLHLLPIRLPGRASGRLPVMITGERLQEPISWTQDQTKRRRMEMVGQMTMGVAHDFNNLLTGILGHIELLRDQLPADSGAVENLSAAERAAKDGAALVRKIQRYIRHEKQERFEPVDLASVVEEVASLTRPYWHNEPRGLGISIELRKEIEEVPLLRGSEAELREVLVNLILNAVQAMPDGGTLTLRVFGDQESVYLEVEDTGSGMPESVQERIFEPLFTTKGEEGSGMGLTVTFGIVEEHEGQIRVRSRPGRGTVFALRFPPAEQAELEPSRPAKSPAPISPTPPGIERLLVVDDEDMVRSVTAKLLRLKGFEVDEAPGGIEALRTVADRSFDAVVTDLGMPEMSGRELARRLRADRPALPIILLTGHTDAEDQSEHVDAVVRKPFQIDELVTTIRRLLAPESIEN